MLCNRIAVLNTRLLALDTPEQLRRRFFRRQIIVQLEALDAKVMHAVKSLPFMERNRPELVKAMVEAGGRVIAVSEKQYPLEEVYLKLIREEDGNES
jgi:ABC-2 type transport system ATP-binding protein